MVKVKMVEKHNKNPTNQRKRKPSVGRGGVPTPPGFEVYPERRHNGAWKKEESARGKFEMWIKMTEEELTALLEKENIASFDESTINLILQLQKMTRLLQDMVTKLEEEKNIVKKVKLTSCCTKQLETIMIITEKLSNQIYGAPVQKVEQTNIELKPILPPLEEKE